MKITESLPYEGPLTTEIPDLFYKTSRPKERQPGLRQFFVFGVIALILALLILTPFSFSIQGVARIQPQQEVELESLVDGELIEVYVKEGDKVTKGQKLGLIYDRMNDQELAEEKAELEATQGEIRRLRNKAGYLQKENQTNRELYLKDAISAYEKNKADFELGDLLQELAILQTKKKKLTARIHFLESLREIGTVRAPLDGILLTKLSHKVSTYFTKGKEIAHIADMSRVVLNMPVYEHQIWRVREKAPVKIKFFSHPGFVFKGRVTGVKPSAYEKEEKMWVKESVIDVLIEIQDPLPFVPAAGTTARVSTSGDGQSLFAKLKNRFWF